MIEPVLIAILLILMRTSAFVVFLPAPLGRGVPATVKIGLAVALTASSATAFAPTSAVALWTTLSGGAAWLCLAYLTLREVLLGVTLGWLFSQVTVPARIAGAYISQEMGLTLGSITSPTDQSPSDPVSEIFENLAVVLLLGLNLHYAWIWAIHQSFGGHPVGGRWVMPSPGPFVDLAARSGILGLMVIAPVVVIMFLALVTMLMTSRSTPQFNLLSYGMTFRIIVALAALILFLPEIVAGLQRSVQVLSWLPGS